MNEEAQLNRAPFTKLEKVKMLRLASVSPVQASTAGFLGPFVAKFLGRGKVVEQLEMRIPPL